MKIVRRGDPDAGIPFASHATGTASVTKVHEVLEPHLVRAVLVSFEPGSRTYWHSHSGGQLLSILAGTGWVQTRGSEPEPVTVGDVVVLDPGEEHSHGAGDDESFLHLATTLGDSVFLEPATMPSIELAR
jgi:quercetin dioxygenase-like cupin family protein